MERSPLTERSRIQQIEGSANPWTLTTLLTEFDRRIDRMKRFPHLRTKLRPRLRFLGDAGRKVDQLEIELVDHLYRVGHFQEAMARATEVRDQAAVALGESHPIYAGCLHRLAILYHAMGDHSAAKSLYLEALEESAAPRWARTRVTSD